VEPGKATLVNAAHDAFNARELDRFLSFWVADCQYTPAVETAVEGEAAYEGHDGLRLWWQRMEERWIDLRTQIDEVQDAGELALAVGRFQATGRQSGVPVDAPLFEVASFRDGSILFAKDFLDQMQAMAALQRAA
jgi:ketosteroid isomerase-like protein